MRARYISEPYVFAPNTCGTVEISGSKEKLRRTKNCSQFQSCLLAKRSNTSHISLPESQRHLLMATTEQKLSKSFVRITLKAPPTHLENRLQTGSTRQATINVRDLENELRSRVRGEVRFSDGDRGL